MADENFWNRTARRYAASPISDEAAYEATTARIEALLRPADDVLEIGCGTGSTALRLAPAVRSVLATDSAAEMIAIAREKAAGVPNIRFDAADAREAGRGETFDAVLALNLLHLLPDPDAVMRAAVARLRPGGVLFTKTACLGGWRAGLFGPLVGGLRLIGKAPALRFLTPAAVEGMHRNAGLAIEDRLLQPGPAPRLFLVGRLSGPVGG